MDTLFWIAVFTSILCGILLICIGLCEEWEYPVGGIGDTAAESPTVQLRRLARQLGKTQRRIAQETRTSC